MASNGMPNGLKRETWRPQPTSSWTPGGRNDSSRPGQNDSPAPGSDFRISPPAGPSRAQYSPPSGPSSSFRADTDRPYRPRLDDRDEDYHRGRLDEDERRDHRGAPASAPNRARPASRAPPEGPKAAGYGRDHIDPTTRAEDIRKGTFRTRAQIEADNKKNGLAPNAHILPSSKVNKGHPPTGPGSSRQEGRTWGAWRDKVVEGDRRVSAGSADRHGEHRYRPGSPGPSRRDRSPPSGPRNRGRDVDDREPARGRRPSPDYATGQADRKRSPSRDSLYSPLPRRRSLSPPGQDRLPPLERKRAPPSPRAGDSKRLRDHSPGRSITSSRRRRSPTLSPSRSRSRSRDRERDRFRPRSPSPRASRHSPSPPRRGRRSPSPYRNRRRSPSPRREPVKMRQWGRRDSPEPPRERSPIPPPRIRPSSPPRGLGGRAPLPPQSAVFTRPDPPARRASPPPPAITPTGPRGPPFGGWGRAPGALPPDEPAFRPPPNSTNHPGPQSAFDPSLAPPQHLPPFEPNAAGFNARPPPTFPAGRAPPPFRPPPTSYMSPQKGSTPPGEQSQPLPEAYSQTNAYPTPPNQPPLSSFPPFAPNANQPPTNGSMPPFAPTGPIRPPAAEPLNASGFKISFGGQQISPVKGDSWKVRPPSVKQFFDDSGPPSPSSRPPSPPPPPATSPPRHPDRPLQEPEIYLDLIDKNEKDYSEHLSTVAPYIRAAFDQWFAQGTNPDLPAFLIHYLGRRPDPTEVAQIETLLGKKTRLSRDQEELRLLHRQAIDLGSAAPSREENGHVNGRDDARGYQRHRSPEKLGSAPPTGPASMVHLIAEGSVPPPQPAPPTQPETPIEEVADTAPSPRASRPADRRRPAVDGELYERIAHVGEGTYGKVYKARNVETGEFYALKRIRMEGEKDGFPVTAMREIKLLQKLKHRNVLRLVEMMVSKGSVYMVLEYMDHDLTGVLAQPNLKFTPANLKSLNYQMLAGLAYLHDQGILHRDMKGSNILLNGAGELKLADFGLARAYSKRQRDDYTNRVITLWYRGPELLLGETVYGPEVDMWSAGCIMLELFCGKPVFQGNDEIHQLEVIYNIMGTPDESAWPGVKDLPWYELVKPKAALPNRFVELFSKWLSPKALELAQGLLEFDTAKRLTAEQAMGAGYFLEEEPGMEMPTQLANCGEHHEMSAKLERARRRQQEGR